MDSTSIHQSYYYNELVNQVQVQVPPQAQAPPMKTQPHSPSSQASFSILALAIIGILTIAFLLIGYYVFAIKCCLNSHRIDILSPFFISRSRRRQDPLIIYSPTIESRGLEASEIRAIPILQFKKTELAMEKNLFECAVCLNEFQDEEKLRVLPLCTHVFHIDCIDVWLQNNANCPLCRSSISMSPPLPNQINTLTSSPRGDNVVGGDQNFVVIEVRDGDLAEQTTREALTSYTDVSIPIRPISSSPRKTEQRAGSKRGRRFHHISSMGDECINVRAKDDQFAVQPIRRSISMDSSNDRQLILSIQDIIQQNKHVSEEASNEVCGSSSSSSTTSTNKFRRSSIFSFRGSRNAVIPTQVE